MTSISPIGSTYAIAQSGLNAATSQLAASAVNIASSGGDPSAQDGVGLASARTDFSANLAVIKTQDQMQKNLLDIRV